MSIQMTRDLLIWCAACVVWAGVEILGAILAKRRLGPSLIGPICRFPLLLLSIHWFYAVMGPYKTRLWGVAVIPFVLFVIGMVIGPKEKWKHRLAAALVSIMAGGVTVGLSLTVHIMLTPRIMGLLQYSMYQHECDFALTQIVFAVLIYLLSAVIIAKRPSAVVKKICLIILIAMFAGIGLFVVVGSAINGSLIRVGSWSAVLFSLVLAVLYLGVLFLSLHRQKQANFEEQLLAEKKRFEENRYNDAEVIWENVLKVRHDIKQHLTILEGYLEDNEIEKCKDYLSDLIGNVDRIGNLLKSENRVLDYLINSKLCGLTDTEVVIAGSVGDLSDIADGDLASIVGNLLDNAVEAAMEASEKRIELHFAMQNSNRILICKNTVKASVLSSNPKLRSTKGGGTHLGLGTHIIRETVAKYHGMIDYFEDHEMFCVQIVLPMIAK